MVKESLLAMGVKGISNPVDFLIMDGYYIKATGFVSECRVLLEETLRSPNDFLLFFVRYRFKWLTEIDGFPKFNFNKN